MKKITVLLADSKNNVITKEELIATAKIADENGIIRREDSGIIENVLQLHDIRVKDILTPRSVVYSIQENDYLASFESNKNDAINLKKLKEYSRIPIFRNNIDDMVGLVISKEYFYEKITNELEDKLSLIKPILDVNENVPVSKLIDMFIESKEHMYLVVDNYGQTEGIVTLEDAVETLLGREIVDELDSHVDMRKVARRKMLRLRAKKNIM
jgi:CBS domain containing-hemolysin-like protein